MNFKFAAVAFVIAATGANAEQPVDYAQSPEQAATIKHGRDEILKTACGENPTDDCREKIAALPDRVVNGYNAAMSGTNEAMVYGQSPKQAAKTTIKHDRDEILKTACGENPTDDCRKIVAALPNRQVHDYYLYDVYTRLWHNSNDLLDAAAKNGSSTNEMQALAHDAVKYEMLSRRQARILGLRDDN
jgi:hypothetical protein